MPAPADPGLLYMALMLRKLHEARPFHRVLDAGIEGRARAVLAEQLPGAAWIGLAGLWEPVLGDIRLQRRPDGRLGVADLRAAAARGNPFDLALLEDQCDGLEAEAVHALAALWLERAALVLAALPLGAQPPGLCARFVTGGSALCCLSGEATRSRQVARLHELLPAMVARLAGTA